MLKENPAAAPGVSFSASRLLHDILENKTHLVQAFRIGWTPKWSSKWRGGGKKRVGWKSGQKYCS